MSEVEIEPQYPDAATEIAPPESVAPEAGSGPHGPQQRQTLSYLRGLLQNYGLQPKHKLGQNFLIDLNLLDLVWRAADLTRDDCVLEVGTGTGSLTSRIAEKAGAVLTVEIDAQIQRVATRLLGPRQNVRMYLGDALARKNELNPEMLQAWAEQERVFGTKTRKLVANLPYVIATPLISNLLMADIPVERMVVMVQWEIAERMRALPGTKDFNALSVLVQSVADVEVVRKVMPANFYPRPKVDSAITLIRPNAAKRALVPDLKRWRAFLRDLYVHRRKNLRQALIAWPTGPREKVAVDAKLAELGFDGLIRSEMLSVADHLKLCEAFG